MGKGLLELHHQVTFYDTAKEVVGQLQKEGLRSTSSLNEAVDRSEVSIICVPTPATAGRIDLQSVKSVVKELGQSLRERSGYHLVVLKSTVVPTTTESIVIPTLEEHSRLKVGEQIGVCVNPEFMTEIHGSWTGDLLFVRDFFHEPMTVIGESDRRSGDYLAQVYGSLDRPIVRTNLVTAEMIKYAFNCALATKISYWNEIFYICRSLNIDSQVVAHAASLDARIGRYGTIHGKAFGGKCLPKDLRAFVQFVTDLGYDPKLLRAVEEINERIRIDRGVRE